MGALNSKIYRIIFCLWHTFCNEIFDKIFFADNFLKTIF